MSTIKKYLIKVEDFGGGVISENYIEYTTPSLYDVYDTTGGQTFTSGTITINLDTERYNNGTFSLVSDEVTVNTDMTAVITFRVSTTVSTGSARSTSYAWLEEDSGSGFVEVPGTRIFMYNRLLNNGHQTATCVLIMDITSGYSYRIRCARLYGTDTLTTIADGSSLTIQEIK